MIILLPYVIIVLFIALWLAISYIRYIFLIQKTLNRCAAENRFMAPGMVWLMLIPFVNIVWHFFVVINVARSLSAEFQKRGIAVNLEPSKKIGLIMCILSFFFFCLFFIPLFGGFPFFCGCPPIEFLDWFWGVFYDGGFFKVTSINKNIYCLGWFLLVLSCLIFWALYGTKIAKFYARLAPPAA